MKWTYLLLLFLIVSCLSAICIPSPAQATSWAYPFVVWEDSIYVVTEEAIGSVEERIGEVTSFSDMEQHGGNFSNIFPKGTAYFEISGTPSTEAIAVQMSEDIFVKAE